MAADHRQRLPATLAGALVAAALVLSVPCGAQKLGTDITNLNLCLYGDCEARGSYAPRSTTIGSWKSCI